MHLSYLYTSKGPAKHSYCIKAHQTEHAYNADHHSLHFQSLRFSEGLTKFATRLLFGIVPTSNLHFINLHLNSPNEIRGPNTRHRFYCRYVDFNYCTTSARISDMFLQNVGAWFVFMFHSRTDVKTTISVITCNFFFYGYICYVIHTFNILCKVLYSYTE